MTVLEVIQRSAEFLAKKGVESPRLQIELLLAHALKLPRLRLYLEFDRALTDPELDLVRSMVKRRGNREPLQHIIGSTNFCGLEIRVTPATLIPRPETELLAERAWEFLSRLRDEQSDPITVLDFGTGSGCLIVTVLEKCSFAKGCALDVSEAALRVARENAERHRVESAIQFVEGNGFGALPSGLQFDLIVSNPPYIPTDMIATLAPEVRDHDPREALDGGADGLVFFHRLAAEAKPFLRQRGKLMFEFGDEQEDEIARIFAAKGWKIEAVENDYTGRPRIMIAAPDQS